MMPYSRPESDDHLSSQSILRSPTEWSTAAIRLLQGVVYYDDNSRIWDIILRFRTPLDEYFAKIGLRMIIDDTDGMAYLRQLDEDETTNESDSLPRLFRRTPLGYEATLLAVLLRDILRQFEEEELHNQRCVVTQHDLLDMWKAFFASNVDDVRLNRTLQAALRKLEELKFVRQFEDEPPSWEIRRILKARLPISELETLRQALLGRVGREKSNEDTTTIDNNQPR